MKKVSLLIICFILLASTAAFAETKIAIFDRQQLITQSLYGQEVKKKIDAKYKARGQQLSKEREALANLKKQIESKAFDQNTMQEKIMELRRRGRDWNEDMSVFQKSVNAEQAKLFGPVSPIAAEVINAYCVAHGYTIVLDKKSPGLLFVSEGLDITDALVKELDKAKKAGK